MSTNWDHSQAKLYKECGAIDEYEFVEGAFEIPIAEDPPTDAAELAAWSPVKVVQAHSPYRRRRVHFKEVKSGSPPILPSPESVGAFQFLGGSLVYQSARLDGSMSNFTWEGMGTYLFVENCRSDPTDGFVLTGKPWTLFSQQEMQVQAGGGVPPYGAVAAAGGDAKAGYVVGQQISLDNPLYTYTIPTYVPAKFFNSEMLNGEAPIVNSGPSLETQDELHRATVPSPQQG